MFNRCKRVFKSFDKIGIEIRKTRTKRIFAFGAISLVIGILFCFSGGKINSIVYLYKMPSGAISYPTMYIIWGISFFLSGAVFSGIFFGCEKYRRHITYKALFIIILMQLCIYLAHPLFFKAAAPFVAFVALALATLFCLFAIFSIYRIYTLWTAMLIIKCVWLFYNTYIILGFAIIN